MTSSQDVYRKVGRGGAGNFQSTKLVTPADTNTQSEVDEVLKIASGHSEPASSGLAKSGRGGAGNFLDASQVPADHKDEPPDHAEAAEAVSASLEQHEAGGRLRGRGGAGNWKSAEEKAAERERRRVEDDERTGRVERLEKNVRHVVDAGVKKPEQAHLSSEKNIDKRGIGFRH